MRIWSLAFLLSAAPAFAQAPAPAQLKAGQLAELCQPTGIAESAMCLSYLNGINDMHKVHVFSGGQPFYCMTPRDTIEQLAALVGVQLTAAPELKNEPAYITLLALLKMNYRCPSPGSTSTPKR